MSPGHPDFDRELDAHGTSLAHLKTEQAAEARIRKQPKPPPALGVARRRRRMEDL